MDKRTKQRLFMAKELRLSIALIVICSLVAGILFIYLIKEFAPKKEHGLFSFIAFFVTVFVGYVIIVVILAIFFTHRFIGPFERLKMEMKLILAGNYHRRLCIRGSDDFYIRTFISEVNNILEKFEKTCIDKERFRKQTDSELLNILALIEKEEVPRERLKEAVLSLHQRVESLFEKGKK